MIVKSSPCGQKIRIETEFIAILNCNTIQLEMQLFVCVNGCWKCLDVQLINGCVPSIGGIELANRQIEPAQWFKVSFEFQLPWVLKHDMQVLVLRSVSVDCSERVVSWDVGESNQSEDGICNRVALAHDRELDSGSGEVYVG